MKRILRLALTAATTVFIAVAPLACGGGDGGGGSAPAEDTTVAVDTTPEGPQCNYTEPALDKTGGASCGFDAEQKGKVLNKHIKNFGLKKCLDNCEECQEPHWLHQDCGTETKVIWMILATGW
jgi:hypothetical protein